MMYFLRQVVSIGILMMFVAIPQAWSAERVEYIIKLKPGPMSLQLNAALRGSKPINTTFGQFQIVKAAAADSNFVAALADDPSIDYIEPNYEYKIQNDPENDNTIGNQGSLTDPREGEQWALSFLNTQAAWNMTKGNSNTMPT